MFNHSISSDQTDPFNRQPLALDMVVPNTDLKTKIEQWLQEHKKKPSTDNQETTTLSESQDNMVETEELNVAATEENLVENTNS